MATGTAHPRKDWGETGVAFHSPKHVKQHCDGNLIPPVFRKDTTSKIENKSSFAIARDELLIAYDEETIDNEEFLLLLKKKTFQETLASLIHVYKTLRRIWLWNHGSCTM